MMHYLPVAIFLIVFKCSLVCALGGPRKSWAFIRDLLTIGDDYWTWTTRSGEWFEDVEIERIEEDELVLRHKFGVVRLAVGRLSEKSRHVLFHTQKWADHVAACGKIEAFPARHRQSVAA
jgi:hypothetical protein